MGAALAQPVAAQAPGGPALVLQRDDRVVLVGNTLAERQQLFNHFETLLMARLPDLHLTIRNLGWSGDTVTLQPRPLNFGDAAMHLERQKADVILAFFGFNESFDGEAGLERFGADLRAYLETQFRARYNGRTAPRVVLVSPLAHEKLAHLVQVDVGARNRDLSRYTDTMRRVAAESRVPFVDLFTPTLELMPGPDALTINGIHVNEAGDRAVAELLMEGLGFPAAAAIAGDPKQLKSLERLRERIRVKNEEFFRRWRPLNAEYIVGRRVEPFGSVNFPGEMKALDARVNELDAEIWKLARSARGLRYPPSAQSAPSAEARQ